MAHVEASNVVPSSMTFQLSENVPEKVARNSPKKTYSRTFLKGMVVGLKDFLRV